MTREEITLKLARAAGVVKLVCGVANNAAWLVLLDGYDHARRCSAYGQRTKLAFKQAVEAWHNYERRLLHTSDNRMFHVEDMKPETRRIYGDISDRQYYDFWASMGGVAYQKTKPLITSLWNKHRLSMLAHGVKDAEHVAWVMTAMAALELAEQLYEKAARQCVEEHKIPRLIFNTVFGQFSLKGVAERWRRAMKMLAPDTEFELDAVERRNIEMGLTQLCEAWLDPKLMYNSTMDTIEDYDEVFASKGYQKKALRQIAEVRDETEAEIEREKKVRSKIRAT